MAVGTLPLRDDPNTPWLGGENRTTPPGEDATAGRRARAVPALVDGQPPGEDNVTGEGPGRSSWNETETTQAVIRSLESRGRPIDFLKIVSEAEEQALLYTNQANRRAWSDALKAYHNEHYNGSKYNRQECRNPPHLFVPQTRSTLPHVISPLSASLLPSI